MKKYKTVKAIKTVKADQPVKNESQKRTEPKRKAEPKKESQSPERTARQQESFEAMLEQSFSGMKRLEPGQSVDAEIISISGDSVFIQLNGKSEGVLNIAEFTDKEGNVTIEEGEQIEAYFMDAKNGEMHFTTRISGDKAGQAVLKNAFDNEIPVEGVVEKEIKGGFEIKLGESRAFCPFSQMGAQRVEDAKSYIGKHLTFKIMEHSEGGRNILVSNRAVLEVEKEKQMESLKKVLKEGDTVDGRVLSIRDFGAFVDIQGIQALLPISEISRSRVKDIQEVLSEGQEIRAQILSLDWARERFSISMKALTADPWDNAPNTYTRGSRHTGTVARITDFGAFVTLEPGVDGLIHVSDMKSDSRDKSPADIVKKGEEIVVIINSVDSEKKRISLKPVGTSEEEEIYNEYVVNDSGDTDGETYNPFAALLKDKKKKK